MTLPIQKRIKTALVTANIPLLDQQVRAALPTVFDGINTDENGLFILLKEEATQADITQALTLATAHNPAHETATQATERVGQTDFAGWQAAVDKSLADIATKRATLAGTPNIANAVALLLEIADDMTLALKAQKYIAKRLPNTQG